MTGRILQSIRKKFSSDLHLAELIKGASSAFLLKVAGMAIGYLSLIYITNVYGASKFGILMICITILSVFTLLPKYGMENALVRIIGELYTLEKTHEINKILKKIFIFTFLISILSTIILYHSIRRWRTPKILYRSKIWKEMVSGKRPIHSFWLHHGGITHTNSAKLTLTLTINFFLEETEFLPDYANLVRYFIRWV